MKIDIPTRAQWAVLGAVVRRVQICRELATRAEADGATSTADELTKDAKALENVKEQLLDAIEGDSS